MKDIEKYNQEELDQILLDSIEKLGINSLVSEESLTKSFRSFMKELLEYNSHTNLTAISDEKEIYIKHFVDSISAIVALEYLKDKEGFDYLTKRYMDVGTGAGFPSIPVKIMLPQIQITLLDSLEKRTRFLNLVAQELQLDNISILHQRAEDAAREKGKRESFDIVLSRAVANLPVLLEYCLPFIKKGGYMICLKGPAIEEELLKSKKALKLLGGELVSVLDVQIPYSDLNHKIAVIKKTRNTDGRYPRKAGKPSKEPLV